eukprot:TRINITY_DN10427_c0_g4_i1.p3 TRINITY_DN10427_c0_g4~~TRINITY_DN10427_c0_g4_i1.p3  ORF type:complete len:211 (-),score=46.41 TRINITY_DN10427_c0_g4_i1:83-715(-)
MGVQGWIMQIKTRTVLSEGEIGQRPLFRHGVVQFDGDWNLDAVAREVAERGLTVLVFDDPDMFLDRGKVVDMCLDMRVRDIDVLWSACLATVPTGGLLKSMRLAGCQRVDMMLNPDEAVEGLFWARRYGFEVRIRNTDGMPYVAERIFYTVAEREAIAERLSGLHAAQFDLAVAYFKAQRYSDVMLPLGKAMTLGFPLNELCLNLSLIHI